MSIEQALIDRAYPKIVAARTTKIIQHEAVKGCVPFLAPTPVHLEPLFVPTNRWNEMTDTEKQHHVPICLLPSNQTVRLQTWISPEHTLEWFRAERFIRELRGISHRIGFEISGNEQAITIQFLTYSDDCGLVKAVAAGEYPHCELADPTHTPFTGTDYQFCDFFSLPPYHHLFTQHRELHTSPYEPFIQSLSVLKAPARGFMQVLFEPARHNWHHNVEVLTDLEFMGRTMPEARSAYRPPQQLPSGDFYQMATEMEMKAHNDKPFYFAALRVGVETPHGPADVRELTAFVSLFQHGGQPLQYLTEEEYLITVPPDQIQQMLQMGLSYRAGFLVNSSELAGLVHLPTMRRFKESEISIDSLETLPIPIRNQALRTGTIIGTCSIAGKKEPVGIPLSFRQQSTHIIGKSGMGKTFLLLSMILHDIMEGHGVAVIDPHNHCIAHLLKLIPEDKVDSVVYLDFADPEWIPLWNPLKPAPRQDIGRTADDLVTAIKSVIEKTGWGDRLEHILRHSFYGLLQTPDATLYDLTKLLRPLKPANNDRNRLKQLIMQSIGSDVSRDFWNMQFDQYTKDDFSPPQNKLSKLLLGGTLELMFSQPESLIKLHEIIESGKILLVNLHGLSSARQEIIGSFFLSLLHQTALTRDAMSSDANKQFHIYCDEAHMMTKGRLELILTEIRKFGVSLTLAHQSLSQMTKPQQDALMSVGSTIIFNLDSEDSQHLIKNLQQKVTVKDITALKEREAIARIRTDIVRITTLPIHPLETSFEEHIIQQSRQQYCRPASEVKRRIRMARNQWAEEYMPVHYGERGEEPPIPVYDEFE